MGRGYFSKLIHDKKVHENHIRRGICVLCKRKARKGRRLCNYCSKKSNAYQRKRRRMIKNAYKKRTI